jgi:hypothetical protein
MVREYKDRPNGMRTLFDYALRAVQLQVIDTDGFHWRVGNVAALATSVDLLIDIDTAAKDMRVLDDKLRKVIRERTDKLQVQTRP